MCHLVKGSFRVGTWGRSKKIAQNKTQPNTQNKTQPNTQNKKTQNDLI
jgi:hypothetical protein